MGSDLPNQVTQTLVTSLVLNMLLNTSKTKPEKCNIWGMWEARGPIKGETVNLAGS